MAFIGAFFSMLVAATWDVVVFAISLCHGFDSSHNLISSREKNAAILIIWEQVHLRKNLQ